MAITTLKDYTINQTSDNDIEFIGDMNLYEDFIKRFIDINKLNILQEKWQSQNIEYVYFNYRPKFKKYNYEVIISCPTKEKASFYKYLLEKQIDNITKLEDVYNQNEEDKNKQQ